MTDERFRAALRAATPYFGEPEFLYDGRNKVVLTLDDARALCEHYAGAAVEAERTRCATIVEDMVRAVDGSDALTAIREGRPLPDPPA